MTKRYFIELAFSGSRFHGWQIQPDAISVQQYLEESLSTILRETIHLTGAGRTDAGVHASYFVAHFDSGNISKSSSLLEKLNLYLSKDLSVLGIREASPLSHARYDAISRTYKYIISRKKQAFLDPLGFPYYGKLNMEAMEIATVMIQKTNDFTSFAKLHSDNKTNICKIFKAGWEEKNGFLVFTIQADRFLRNMIRALTGTLLDVGKEKINPEEFREIILSLNNQNASASAPAKGLYLCDIEYPESFGLTNPGKENLLPFIL